MRYHRTTSTRARRKALEEVREALGDKLFADFVTHALSENPAISATKYPSLVVLWLRGRTAHLSQEASTEDAEEGYSA